MATSYCRSRMAVPQPNRRFKDLFLDICEDMGGAERMSSLEKQLARRAAQLSAECERMKAMDEALRPARIRDSYGGRARRNVAVDRMMERSAVVLRCSRMCF
jgi:hypothetical protein